MSNSAYVDKITANNQAREFGMRAYFYNEEECQLLKDELNFYGFNVEFNAKTLHTYMPPIILHPNPEPLFPGDEFGFVRLSAKQFFAKGQIANLISCHGFLRHNPHPVGNLGYLTNPAWSSFGIFKSKDSVSNLINDAGYQLDTQFMDGLPNLIACVNVLLGYSPLGQPSVFFSRVYGDSTNPNLLDKLINYFTYNQGCRAYVGATWGMAKQTFNGSELIMGEGYPHWCYGSKISGKVKTALFLTPPLEAQIVTSPGGLPVFRYPDIDAPYVHVTNEEVVYLAEIQRSALLKAEAPNPVRQGLIIGINKTRRKTLREYVVKNFNNSPDAQINLSPRSFVRCVGCGDGPLIHRDINSLKRLSNNQFMCPRCQEKMNKISQTPTTVTTNDETKTAIGV